jgi:hypothetical protein
MSIRKSAMSAAVAGVGLLALGSAPASATTVLRLDPGPVAFTHSTITNTSSHPAVLARGAAGTSRVLARPSRRLSPAALARRASLGNWND